MTEPSDQAAVRPFGDFAPSYWNKGLSVIPLEPESKRPARQILGWQGYVNGPPSLSKQQEWLSRYAGRGIGLLLSTAIATDDRLGAVDVDQDQFIKVVEVILCQS